MNCFAEYLTMIKNCRLVAPVTLALAWVLSLTAFESSVLAQAQPEQGLQSLFNESGPKAPEGKFVDHLYRDADGEHKYVVFEPLGYSTAKKWPVVFYLHGASGRGRDGRSQLIVGLGPAVKARAGKLPFLVVFPQNENLRSRLLGGWIDGSNELDRALKILGEVEQTYSVDKSHEVLVGVSMGAFGAWSVAANSPQRWKAVIAVSGGGEASFVPALTKVPIWAFHAADDQLVPPVRSTGLVADINAAGGRAYVSVTPSGGHNIGATVLARDEVFEWLEHPEREAKTDIDWSKQPAMASMIDELPFVPGADVASAARVRVNRDLLETISFLFADQIPRDTLQGWRPGSHEESGMRSTTIGGTYYQGYVERVSITPMETGHLRLQVGIRNMAMTVTDAQISAPLVNAQAGPMTIYFGYHSPVWLTMDVLPHVVERRIRLELAGVHFQIPNNNWSISRPEVSVRPLPFLEDRIADRLVEGAAQKKGTIEQSFRDKVPDMLAQMESRLNRMCERTMTYRQFPMPLWQPRFRLYPETIKVDPQGLELTMGATVAALAPRSKDIPIRPFPVGDEVAPEAAKTGLDLAISLRLADAYASNLSASDVGRFNVVDMNSPGLRKMGTHEFWNTVLPADQQLDPTTELNAEFVIAKPFHIEPTPSEEWTQGKLGHLADLVVPQLQLLLSTRKAGERDWTDRITAELVFRQGTVLNVNKPGFSTRQVKLDVQPIDRPSVTAHWLTGETSQLDTDKIAQQFEEGWSASFGARDREKVMKDLKLQQMALRLDEMGNTKSHLVVRLQRPGVRVRNPSDQAIEYQVRAVASAWSKPLRLEPGKVHEFRPVTAMTWHMGEKEYTLPLGFDAQVRKDAETGTFNLFQWVEELPK